jgi:hypothetical protein
VKKSELKKRILEALTPDEASKVDAKYKEIYAGMVGKNPLKMKKYDNPDKVAYGRAINLIQKESLKLAEKLGKTADVGDYKDDFRKSDAPQFKGKSKKKRDQMATAAFLNKEEKTLEEIDNLMNETGQEIAKKNMDDYKRLNELVKAALMKETSTDKYDDNPALKGKQSELPDGLQKSIIKKSGGKVDEIKERILRELRGNINEMAGEDLELKSLAKKIIPTLKKLGFEVEYSTDTSMKTLKNAGDKFVALRIQDGMLGAHIPFKSGLNAAKEIQKEIQKSLGNEFEYKLTKSKRGPGLEFYTILIRNK